jgi:hypothetical protein
LVTVGTSPRGEPIILILAPLEKKETFQVNNKKRIPDVSENYYIKT